jgi:hypothetical protein
MQREGTKLVLEGHGEVTEVLPFVFLKDGNLVYDRFAFISTSFARPRPYEEPTEEIWRAAIKLLESKVMTTDLLPGQPPESSQLGFAALIAAAVHRNQQDKHGFPYLEHPRRVFLNSEWSLDPEVFGQIERMIGYQAAWLHDVLEDSQEFFYRQITPLDLSNWGFDFEVIATVMKLTKSKEKTKEEYYAQINADPIARAVKLADIADNLAEWRQELLDQQTQSKLKAKYQHALRSLDYSIHDDNWLELRITSFDQGPLPLFAYPESKTALKRAEARFTVQQANQRRVPKGLYRKLEMVNEEVYHIRSTPFWREKQDLPQGDKLPERFSLDALYATYLALMVKEEGGRGEWIEPDEHESLGAILDSLNRSEASFEFQHLGVIPRETTSLDMKLRLTRAVTLLRKLRLKHDDWIFSRKPAEPDSPSMDELIKAADLDTVIDAAFLDFPSDLLPWGGTVFKGLLSEIFYLSEDER